MVKQMGGARVSSVEFGWKRENKERKEHVKHMGREGSQLSKVEY